MPSLFESLTSTTGAGSLMNSVGRGFESSVNRAIGSFASDTQRKWAGSVNSVFGDAARQVTRGLTGGSNSRMNPILANFVNTNVNNISRAITGGLGASVNSLFSTANNSVRQAFPGFKLPGNEEKTTAFGIGSDRALGLATPGFNPRPIQGSGSGGLSVLSTEGGGFTYGGNSNRDTSLGDNVRVIPKDEIVKTTGLGPVVDLGGDNAFSTAAIGGENVFLDKATEWAGSPGTPEGQSRRELSGSKVSNASGSILNQALIERRLLGDTRKTGSFTKERVGNGLSVDGFGVATTLADAWNLPDPILSFEWAAAVYKPDSSDMAIAPVFLESISIPSLDFTVDPVFRNGRVIRFLSKRSDLTANIKLYTTTGGASFDFISNWIYSASNTENGNYRLPSEYKRNIEVFIYDIARNVVVRYTLIGCFIENWTQFSLETSNERLATEARISIDDIRLEIPEF